MRRSLGFVLSLALALVGVAGGAEVAAVHADADRALPAGALATLHDLPEARASSYQDWNWATPDDAFPFRDAAGNLGVATHSGSQLVVDTYDPSTYAPVGSEQTVSLSGWPDWGGFYAAPSGDYFVLVGKDNHAEDDSQQVVALRRYSSDWSLLGTAYVKGGASQGSLKGIYEPFDAGNQAMLQVGDRLVVHMSRLMYAIDGVHHQSNLTFEVDLTTMSARTFDAIGGDPFSDDAYSSHSFAQYVAMSGSSLLTVDHGDAYPRTIQLGVEANYPTGRSVQTYSLFPFNGATGNNFTGATVDGLVTGPGGAVVVGTSIRQPGAPDGTLGSADEARNAFLIHADPATGAHTVTWLTSFAANGSTTALEPRIAQVAPDRFAILFGVHEGSGYRAEYRLVDSAGAVLASRTFDGYYFSSISDPVVIGDKLLWVGVAPSGSAVSAYLFGLDVGDPANPTWLADGGGGTTDPPSNVDAPLLKGRGRAGSTLTISPGTWQPAADSYVYRWYRGDARMRGVHGTTYNVRGRDSGSQIRVKVVARNAVGSGSAWSNTKTVR